MKQAKDDRPIKTIPHGVYEGGMMNPQTKESSLNDIATDAQNNGYPTKLPKEGARE